MTESEHLLREVEKLVSSSVLHGSESLCKLLRYLAKQAVEHPGVAVKEYQIATEVFGRPADFDPQSDSAIRVQAGRLRAKISEYYASEGASDPIVIELPKGTYVLNFHQRANGDGKAAAVHEAETPGVGPDARSSRKAVVALTVLSAALAICLVAVVGTWMHSGPTESTAVVQADTAPAVFRTFWKPFLTGPEEPWVVFSNAAFVGRPETGIRYYDPGRDSKDAIWDHYTGVGEVLAVHNLDRIFGQLHRNLRVKRGSLLSLDDVSNNDLIFVGSPSENLTLKEIPTTKDFVFQRMTSGPRKGDLAIVNVHPESGEQTDFLASPSGQSLSEDYAVIALMPGLNPARSVMILAGTTTFGTQAAAEYLARPDSVQDLLKHLDTSNEQKMPPFEAVLHVKVTRGVPLEAQLVAVRRRQGAVR